jgi:hypothetical protein
VTTTVSEDMDEDKEEEGEADDAGDGEDSTLTSYQLRKRQAEETLVEAQHELEQHAEEASSAARRRKVTPKPMRKQATPKPTKAAHTPPANLKPPASRLAEIPDAADHHLVPDEVRHTLLLLFVSFRHAVSVSASD